MERDKGKNLPENTFFLSDVLNEKVLLRGKKIGKLSDLTIQDKDKAAEVTHLIITRPFGYASLMVPWDNVMLFDSKEIAIDIDDIEKFSCKIPQGLVLLRDHIMDKKILDMEDNDVELVYDVKMVIKKNKLYVTDVDPASYARLRRLGLNWLVNLFHGPGDDAEHLKEMFGIITRAMKEDGKDRIAPAPDGRSRKKLQKP